MEIGAYSFGDTPRNPDGSLRSTAEAIHNLFGAIVHAGAREALRPLAGHVAGVRHGRHYGVGS